MRCAGLERAVVFSALVMAGTPIVHADDNVLGDAVTVRDFMIQNVCLDRGGAVLSGIAPIDGDPACVAQRDLRPEEPLPYHKHDHVSPEQRTAAPSGYQRHDSFPVETADLGTVVEHSFDFGAGDDRRFGVFDADADGGDIAILSPGAASIGATAAGGAEFGLWVGECRGVVSAAALAHSWLVAAYESERLSPLHGETIAHLSGLEMGHRVTCPTRFKAAFTAWRVVPFRYRTAAGQDRPITLTTLISDHYGGADPATADHVERFYFTRELGGVRWERWQNANGNGQLSAAKIAGAAAWFAGSARCSPSENPAGAAPMVLVDCREWTRIVAPDHPAGDRPGLFLDAIRARPAAPAFFAPPSHRK